MPDLPFAKIKIRKYLKSVKRIAPSFVFFIFIYFVFAYQLWNQTSPLHNIYIFGINIGNRTKVEISSQISELNKKISTNLYLAIDVDGKTIHQRVEDVAAIEEEKIFEYLEKNKYKTGPTLLPLRYFISLFTSKKITDDEIFLDTSTYRGVIEKNIESTGKKYEDNEIFFDNQFKVKRGNTGYMPEIRNLNSTAYHIDGRVYIPIKTNLVEPLSDIKYLEKKSSSMNAELLHLSQKIIVFNFNKNRVYKKYSQIFPALKVNTLGEYRLDQGELSNIFSSEISKYTTLPSNSHIVFSDDKKRVLEFTPARTGKSIDFPGLSLQILEHINNTTNQEVTVGFLKKEPLINPAKIAGFPDHLGSGFSSFTGSDKARDENIRNALSKMKGVIVKKGDIFSLNKTLRPYTEENGYTEGAAISQGKIINSIGGGLCQIGTTVFRAIMNSGLPVTERRNHTYALSWYFDSRNSLPGTDATIYDGVADLKFKNDTEGDVLIWYSERGTGKLFVEFYGISDGRQGSYSEPEYTFQSKLKLDEVMKIETKNEKDRVGCSGPFYGSNTKFTYTIIDKDGKKIDKVFSSEYRPLPKTCVTYVGATTTKTVQ